MNCCVPPTRMLGLEGVTATDCSTGAVTVSVVLAEMAPSVAVIFAAPAVTPDARPAPLTIATAVVPEDQATKALMSRNVPSE